MSAPLPSAAEQAIIDRFERAPAAPESWQPDAEHHQPWCVASHGFGCICDRPPIPDAAPTAEHCTDCGAPLAQPDELESGLCLRCLNGPPPSAAVPDPAEVEAARGLPTDPRARLVVELLGIYAPYLPAEYDGWAADADHILAALSVRPAPDREALARVEAVCDELERTPFVDYVSRDEISREHARRIRAALGTGDGEGQHRG